MKNRSRTAAIILAAAALATSASSALAGPILLATSGNNLFRYADNAVQHFTLADSIIASNRMADGRILAYSNTPSGTGFEVYELLDAAGANPHLQLIRSDVYSIAPSYTQVGDTLYAVQQAVLYNVDPVTFSRTPVGSLGLEGDAKTMGGSAYDPDNDKFYVVTRDNHLYAIDYALTSGPDPLASVIGPAGVRMFNHGLEWFEGSLYAAVQDELEQVMRLGTLDTSTGAFNPFTTINIADFGGTDATSMVVITSVPAPSALALTGVALAAASRRRRRN